MATATSRTRKKTPTPEILTLSEAAKYLRVSQDTLEYMASEESIPARKFGKEWRFSKSALEAWMRWANPIDGLVLPRWLWPKNWPQQPAEVGTTKEELLKLAGVWKDDPTVEEMVKEIYRQRKLNVIENQE